MTLVDISAVSHLIEGLVGRMIDAAGTPEFDRQTVQTQAQLLTIAGATIAVTAVSMGIVDPAAARITVIAIIDELLGQLLAEDKPKGEPGMKPTVGRIVHYFTNHQPDQSSLAGHGPYAAIVTAVRPSDAVNLMVFGTADGPREVGSVPFREPGDLTLQEPPPQFWAWPPRDGDA